MAQLFSQRTLTLHGSLIQCILPKIRFLSIFVQTQASDQTFYGFLIWQSLDRHQESLTTLNTGASDFSQYRSHNALE